MAEIGLLSFAPAQLRGMADAIMLVDGDRDHMNESRLKCEQTQALARFMRVLAGEIEGSVPARIDALDHRLRAVHEQVGHWLAKESELVKAAHDLVVGEGQPDFTLVGTEKLNRVRRALGLEEV